MRWSFDPGFDAASRAALTAGKPLVYTCPPAAWMVAPLFESILGERTADRFILALVPDCGVAPELATHVNAANHVRQTTAPRVALAVSGFARAGTVLGTGKVSVVIATPGDAYALLGRSTFATTDVTHTVLLWPELFAHDDHEPCELLLGDMSAAQRIIATAHPEAADTWIERYARRAPAMKGVEARQTGHRVRAAVVGYDAVPGAVASALDTLAPRSTVLWDPSPICSARWVQYDGDPTVTILGGSPPPQCDVAIATDLPSPEVLETLQGHANRVVVLHRAYQTQALGMIAAVQQVAISRESDRARRAAVDMRTKLRTRLGASDLTGELLLLAPLFDEFDPAIVAASLVQEGGTDPAPSVLPSWVRIKLAVGKRDRIKPGDIVGALINAAQTPKDHVGQIDLRETFAIVEVRAESAEAALKALTEVILRGRPVKPQVDVK